MVANRGWLGNDEIAAGQLGLSDYPGRGTIERAVKPVPGTVPAVQQERADDAVIPPTETTSSMTACTSESVVRWFAKHARNANPRAAGSSRGSLVKSARQHRKPLRGATGSCWRRTFWSCTVAAVAVETLAVTWGGADALRICQAVSDGTVVVRRSPGSRSRNSCARPEPERVRSLF